MKIAVIGPGAVGTTIAYELQQSLPNVTLIGRSNKIMTSNLQMKLLKSKVLMT